MPSRAEPVTLGTHWHGVLATDVDQMAFVSVDAYELGKWMTPSRSIPHYSVSPNFAMVVKCGASARFKRKCVNAPLANRVANEHAPSYLRLNS